MTTWQWGAGSNPHAVGLDLWVSGTTVYWELRSDCTYANLDDNQSWSVSGATSASGTDYRLNDASIHFLGSGSFAGTPGTSYTVNGNLFNIYGTNNNVPQVSLTVTVPISPPAAPTGVSAARVTDSKATVSWTNTNPGSSTNPYHGIRIYRSKDSAPWQQIASLGVVSSYTDNGISIDHSYWYLVKAYNTAGEADATASSTIYTTPAAPGKPSAVKSGTSVVLTFTNPARHDTGLKVYDSPNGSTWTLVATVATGGTTTYTDTAPSTALTYYAVTATRGSLESAKSPASDPVTILQAPLAPTLNMPLDARDAAEAIGFQWKHNPADTTAQTAYEFQRRVSGGSWSAVVTTGATNVAGNVWQLNLAAGTLTNGLIYEWQVRTKGAHANWSPWSALGSFPTSTRPTATISVPGAEVTTSRVTVTWAYYDAESTAQAGWRATLTNGTVTEVLVSGTGTETAGSATFATTVPDASSWTVKVQVQDGSGLWSAEDTQAFDVVYSPPAVPTLAAAFSVDTGSVSLTVTNPIPVGDEVGTADNDLYRSVDGGVSWVLIGEGIPVNGSMTDWLPIIGGTTMYRAVALSSTPSSATSTSTPVDTTTAAVHGSWVWLNAGDNFSTSVRVKHGARLRVRMERDKVRNRYAGRVFGLETVGEGREHGVTVTARLGVGASSLDALAAMLDRPAPICYRDPSGRRWFCSPGPLDHTHEGIVKMVTFSLEREDFYE